MTLRPPPIYFEVRASQFSLMKPWRFVELAEDDWWVEMTREELGIETGLDFLPFAVRDDVNDIAGFLIENGQVLEKVISVHLTYSNKREPNFVRMDHSNTLMHWIRDIAINDAVILYEQNAGQRT